MNAKITQHHKKQKYKYKSPVEHSLNLVKQ